MIISEDKIFQIIDTEIKKFISGDSLLIFESKASCYVPKLKICLVKIHSKDENQDCFVMAHELYHYIRHIYGVLDFDEIKNHDKKYNSNEEKMAYTAAIKYLINKKGVNKDDLKKNRFINKNFSIEYWEDLFENWIKKDVGIYKHN